jgi:hypothetical protein
MWRNGRPGKLRNPMLSEKEKAKESKADALRATKVPDVTIREDAKVAGKDEAVRAGKVGAVLDLAPPLEEDLTREGLMLSTNQRRILRRLHVISGERETARKERIADLPIRNSTRTPGVILQNRERIGRGPDPRRVSPRTAAIPTAATGKDLSLARPEGRVGKASTGGTPPTLQGQTTGASCSPGA